VTANRIKKSDIKFKGKKATITIREAIQRNDLVRIRKGSPGARADEEFKKSR